MTISYCLLFCLTSPTFALQEASSLDSIMADAINNFYRPLHFLSLPLEIRELIYHHIFKDTWISVYRCGAPCYTHNHACPLNGRTETSLSGVLTINKQVRDECLPVFWDDVFLIAQADMLHLGIERINEKLWMPNPKYVALQRNAKHMYFDNDDPNFALCLDLADLFTRAEDDIVLAIEAIASLRKLETLTTLVTIESRRHAPLSKDDRWDVVYAYLRRRILRSRGSALNKSLNGRVIDVEAVLNDVGAEDDDDGDEYRCWYVVCMAYLLIDLKLTIRTGDHAEDDELCRPTMVVPDRRSTAPSEYTAPWADVQSSASLPGCLVALSTERDLVRSWQSST